MDTIAVIMAGGKGTRIASLRADVPKPMIDVCGKPVLEHQLECLKRNGITQMVFVIGHMGDVIQRYFESGERWGVKIHYIREATPLGTAGALFYLKELHKDFFLINGDIIFDVDLSRMMAFHHKSQAEITLFSHPSSHPQDSTLIVRDETGKVIQISMGGNECVRNCVNAGIHILSPNVLQNLKAPEPCSLDRDIIKTQVEKGQVYAYLSPEYVHDMGTPERYQTVCADIKSGVVASKNLIHPQKAIFLDRDGTINIHCGYITEPKDLMLEPRAAQAVRLINQSGYLAIVITNQPVISRGDCTFEELHAIHARLDSLLGQEGAYLDDILICPHHPDRGFPGERLEYKKDCTCRKPKPGLLLEAAERYHIDLSASYMIGDEERDIAAGHAAGCKAIRIGQRACLRTEADAAFSDLYEAVTELTKK